MLWNNQKYRIHIVSFLKHYLNNVKRYVVGLFLLSIISVMVTFLPPVIYRIFIDDIIVGGQFSKFFSVVLIGYLGIQLVKTISSYLHLYCNNRLSYHLLFNIKSKIFSDFVRKDLNGACDDSIANVKMNIEDDTAFIRGFVEKQIIHYIISAISILISCSLLFSISWKLAVIAVLMIPLTLYFDLFISNKEKNIVELNRKNDEQMISWFYASLSGWKEIKALNLEKYEKRKYVRFLNKFAKLHTLRIQFFVIRSLVMPWVKDKFVMQLLLYFIGGLFVIQSDLTIGLLVMFIQYNTVLADSVKELSTADGELRNQKSIIDRVIKLLTQKTLQRQSTKWRKKTTIELSNVSFRYPDQGRLILNNINLTIQPGDRVVISGKSGEGKSTLLKMITGMIEPVEGSVAIAGISIQNINKRSLYKKLGYVMQETSLFHMTIREYFLFIKPHATEEEITMACKKAQIYNDIQLMSDKLDSNMGEGGSKLSGGQKQRIILAGQLLKDAEIIVLDEATKHLDQQTEDLLYTALNELSQDKIIIYITHRKSVVPFGNRFLYVKDGNVIENALLMNT
ncbi:ABC transporter ATP-binding protein [Paenibacillus agilis]|uniref:ABC transporter ATP-binding protein n=1 Tax=Paenibacillus agilis TaxID=3020863 RepID=A0A559J0Y6_9BACL|nr:ABC transporter ATP-binding protein [Paenibacillus agilis]TVX93559.1 ABC transporter ATP-binding protein [Paenibacillus agilis]